MSGLYKQFETDTNIEQAGVLLEYGENSKGKTIAIRIARAGGANSKFQKLMEARVKPYRRQIQTETVDRKVLERIMREVYAEAVVLGWENVEDRNNNPMPFSVENCIKLFTDLPDLFTDIQQQSERVALFRQDILETDSKN